MTRPPRYLLIGTAALPALAALLLLAANLYANSGHFKRRVSTAVEGNLGLSPRFSLLTFTPWSGLVVRGLASSPPPDAQPETDPANGNPARALATARKITVRPRLSTIFSKEIEIAELGIEGASVDCLRTADGRFLLPLPDRPLAIAKVAKPPPPRRHPKPPRNQPDTRPPPPQPRPPGTPAAETPPQPTPTPTPAAAPPAAPRLPHGIFLHQLDRRVGLASLSLSDGAFRLNAEGLGRPLLEVSKYALDIDLADKSAAHGTLEVGEVSVLGVPVARGFQAKVELLPDGNMLVRQIRSRLFRGEATGELAVKTNAPGLPYRARAAGRGIALAAFGERFKEAGLPYAPDRGEARFHAAAKGLFRAPETLGLEFAASADGVEVPEIRSLLPAVNAIGGGRAHMLKEAVVGDFSLRLKLERGTVLIHDFRAGSPYLVLRGNGAIGEGGQLDVRARLYVTTEGKGFFEELEKDLPETGRTTFQPLPHTSWFYRDLTVGGTLQKPVGDFLQPGRPVALDAAIAEIRSRANPKP